LGSDGERVQVVFVTVDPQRDTPEVLRAYMQSFDPSFVALVPDAPTLRKVADEYKVFYRQVDGPTPTSYTMEHTAGAYIYDPSGALRLYARYGASVESLVQDVQLLLVGISDWVWSPLQE
jgi:protein SCO1/2